MPEVRCYCNAFCCGLVRANTERVSRGQKEIVGKRPFSHYHEIQSGVITTVRSIYWASNVNQDLRVVVTDCFTTKPDPRMVVASTERASRGGASNRGVFFLGPNSAVRWHQSYATGSYCVQATTERNWRVQPHRTIPSSRNDRSVPPRVTYEPIRPTWSPTGTKGSISRFRLNRSPIRIWSISNLPSISKFRRCR